MNNKQKLELTWIGKDNPEYDIANIEPRILEENPELSNCANDPNTENMLIHGDNLLALKALLPEYEGKIKCIYIDPPYNTGNAFEHYDDSVEHSTWLSLMRPRLELLRILLSDDGVIFVQIDDSEGDYLKVLLDEVFGRDNFETTFYIKVRHENRILREDSRYQLVMEQVHSYRKSSSYSPLRRDKIKNANDDYMFNVRIKDNPDRTEKISGYDVEIYNPLKYEITKTLPGEGDLKQYQIRGSLISQSGSASEYYEKNLRSLKSTDGLGTLYKVLKMGEKGDGLGYRFIMHPTNSASKNGFYFQGKPLNKKESTGIPFPNFYDFVNEFNNVGYEGGVEFKNGKKPEIYIKFLLELAKTEVGDFVFDSFLGSGTTAAVAHKMGRKYIGIEMGEQAYTHAKKRIDLVINNEDMLGVTESTSWKGGGAYKFYELAPSFIVKDEFGNPVIDGFYNDSKLIKAMCKLMNFTYQPSQTEYWKHGVGQGKNYLYITTQLLTSGMVQQIVGHLAEGESLIICPKKYEPGADKIDSRITVKKIPQSVLKACHFGKKEYLLPIKESAMEEVEVESGEENDEGIL